MDSGRQQPLAGAQGVGHLLLRQQAPALLLLLLLLPRLEPMPPALPMMHRLVACLNCILPMRLVIAWDLLWPVHPRMLEAEGHENDFDRQPHQ